MYRKLGKFCDFFSKWWICTCGTEKCLKGGLVEQLRECEKGVFPTVTPLDPCNPLRGNYLLAQFIWPALCMSHAMGCWCQEAGQFSHNLLYMLLSVKGYNSPPNSKIACQTSNISKLGASLSPHFFHHGLRLQYCCRYFGRYAQPLRWMYSKFSNIWRACFQNLLHPLWHVTH